ncbi:MAG: class I SAM-dependent methyltransferase [Actinomycetota bacterium]
MVHEVAQAGFGNAADYEAARPGYPPEAVDWLVTHLRIGPGRRVCDLAAGTGKFTRLLLSTGAALIAVEPVAGMRAQFRAVLPDTALAASTAEALPFVAAALDAVIVAQAWHWFDPARAGAELRRVVRPGGGVGMVWNARDRTVGWVDEIWTIMDRVEKRAPWRDHEQWRDSARDIAGFTPMEVAQFTHSQTLTPEDVVRRVASVSHVAVLPDAQRRAVLGEVRAIATGHPQTRGRETLELPYRVDCFACSREAHAGG